MFRYCVLRPTGNSHTFVPDNKIAERAILNQPIKGQDDSEKTAPRAQNEMKLPPSEDLTNTMLIDFETSPDNSKAQANIFTQMTMKDQPAGSCTTNPVISQDLIDLSSKQLEY